MDDNYQTYLNRVARMTLPEAYRSQVQHIQESSKFQPTPDGARQAAPFPGYTVITPPWEEETENSNFYAKLEAYQQELLQLPVGCDLIVPVPPASFHLTLADLIWDSAFRDACEKNSEFEQQLRSCFIDIFQQYQQSLTGSSVPIRWQTLGLMIMPRAVGVCLVPQDESFYEQIVNLRRAIYQNPQLIALGIEQQYHFTAHITLGYFGEVPPELDRDRLATVFSQLNQQWLMNSLDFVAHRAELRKFDDMTRYYREPDWPVLNFS
ncbi:hypothetical protein PCC6912_49070 [Chlorogloeopsis fritschii PCC 6912]|uniref:Uncharacterized protein n=1 Tax=Chlorogloeopsis fritschii PCC 6912 TaxID=211165 RepID=A0A433N242_CHLFR|nr:DUF1868 domain-containing protein [Chlorogloeopsis fritschii]MBF2007700.1 DUF1868 domain-containing protein [Chlorogloeopsis fritschii C42_A2020_084]RUR75064.1 hypothetical protein PCC6912_49070 [Chlorogloeopsis fritschii PCC 6912]